MSIELDFDNGSKNKVPENALFKKWVSTVLEMATPFGETAEADSNGDAELSIRIVDENEMTRLNQQFRDKEKSTNVLSFPADIPPELEMNLLGDIAICAPVIEREAIEQGKGLEAHYAHMSVHGVLHLMGYDHIEDIDAEQMETLEVKVLKHLGYSNPYIQEFEHNNS